jgi:hypothetical protein
MARPKKGNEHDTVHNREMILDGVRSGSRLDDIANQIGCSRQAIYLMRQRDAEFSRQYWDARGAQVEARIDEYQDMLVNATDRTEVMKYKELLAHVRWEAEKLIPQLRDTQRHEVKVEEEPGRIIEIRWADDAPDVMNAGREKLIDVTPKRVTGEVS